MIKFICMCVYVPV